MESKEADKLYEVSQLQIVMEYYYGRSTRDYAFATFKCIEQEKSTVPLLDTIIHESFERVLKKIREQHLDIEQG